MTPNDAPKGVELLACPFCGSPPVAHEHKGIWRMHFLIHCETPRCPATPGRGSGGPSHCTFPSREEAIAAWNRRANVEASVAELRGANDLLRRMFDEQWRSAEVAIKEANGRAERLAEALRWYAEQAALCRKLGAAGDEGRQALDADGGSRARASLTAPAQPGETE